MGRPRASEAEEDRHRRRGRRDDELEEDDEDEQLTFEYEERRHRKASTAKKSRYADDEEEDDDEGSAEEDSHRHKQLVVHQKSKKGKSRGKEVARKKHEVVSESEEESSEQESSEEEEKSKKKKKKNKKKGKALKSETVEIKVWVAVLPGEVDHDFARLVIGALDIVWEKFDDGVDEGFLLRNTQTGEYNIDRFFEEGVFSHRDKKKWKELVAKIKKDPRRKPVLFDRFKTGQEGPSMAQGPSMAPMGRQRRGGHTRFNPHCLDCLEFDEPCCFADY